MTAIGSGGPAGAPGAAAGRAGSPSVRTRPPKIRPVEPEQQAERRVVLRKEGTTAYWKAAFHAPPFEDESFFPMLVADAVLNGAAGLNIWSLGGVSRPQRSARLYRALVDKGLASSASGALMPTEHPYLYSINVNVADGQTLASVEEVVLAELRREQGDGAIQGCLRCASLPH